MLSVASHHTRIIIGRLTRGSDLLRGLLEVCAQRQVRCASVTALGAVETAEVSHYDVRNKHYHPPRKLAGPLEILSLTGNLTENQGELAPHVHVTLSREGDNGIEVLGGHLVSAQVFACEYTIFALDDVLLRRGPDKDTGLRLWEAGFEAGSDPLPNAFPSTPPPGAELAVEGGEPVAVSPAGESPTTAAKRAPRLSIAKAAPRQAPSRRVQRTHEAEEGPRSPIEEVEAVALEASLDRGEKRPSPPPEATWQDVISASGEAQGAMDAARIEASRSLGFAASIQSNGADDLTPVGEESLGEDEEVYELAPGDIVEHPKFGRCVVERVEGDGEYVQVRLRSHSLVRLSLDVISLELIAHESGHQIFRAKIES
jgi:uncharacterized protein